VFRGGGPAEIGGAKATLCRKASTVPKSAASERQAAEPGKRKLGVIPWGEYPFTTAREGNIRAGCLDKQFTNLDAFPASPMWFRK